MSNSEITKFIREARAEGIMGVKIAEGLNNLGAKSPQGKPFTHSTVSAWALKHGVKRLVNRKKGRKRLVRKGKTERVPEQIELTEAQSVSTRVIAIELPESEVAAFLGRVIAGKLSKSDKQLILNPLL
jgi:hypothetical protein